MKNKQYGVPKKKLKTRQQEFVAIVSTFQIQSKLKEPVIDKNPTGYEAETPLHEAACSGLWPIMKYVENKNPKSHIGFTPLHYAAQDGHL